RFGQEQRGGTRPAFGYAAHRAPFAAVVGELHVVARRVAVLRPMQDETAEFTRPSEIDAEPLLATRARLAAPCSFRVAVEHARGTCARLRRRCAHLRLGPRCRLRRPFLQSEVADIDRSVAAAV